MRIPKCQTRWRGKWTGLSLARLLPLRLELQTANNPSRNAPEPGLAEVRNPAGHLKETKAACRRDGQLPSRSTSSDKRPSVGSTRELPHDRISPSASFRARPSATRMRSAMKPTQNQDPALSVVYGADDIGSAVEHVFARSPFAWDGARYQIEQRFCSGGSPGADLLVFRRADNLSCGSTFALRATQVRSLEFLIRRGRITLLSNGSPSSSSTSLAQHRLLSRPARRGKLGRVPSSSTVCGWIRRSIRRATRWRSR